MASNIKAQLKRLDVSKLKMKSGKSLEEELKRHAEVLCDCILYELDKVYASYTPSVYRRSYDLYNSIYIDSIIQVTAGAKGQALSLAVKFDDGALHKGFNGEAVNVAVLLNEGWQTRGQFAHVPYLGYRKGSHFIESGIERYKHTVSNPFPVCLNINEEVQYF